ncbi:MFS transporter [Cellulomonas carbonis]|uniref:MFS transporter n=1 Tax=Cellulomonas carbonis T26 TaxID=947969 RepID=A0A0A0BRJ8_9CELL|nr:MFS transporter [Cellulomonas carbonis]KGM10227.1 MFS transporter [Cellulomonas carbonis T26]GGC16850.1 MFS transporter [Cellulomonas carbonis]
MTPQAPPRRSLVHHPDFRLLWAGDAAGQLGAQLTGLVLPIYAVSELHATEWQMGALSAAETAAFLVIGLPAGAWVDRMRKRRTLVVADLARALVLGTVVAAALAGHGSMGLLLVAAAAISVASVFFDVAHQSYVPGLVGLDHVVEGNAKLQATQSVALVAAPALGGALLRVVSAPVIMIGTVGTYALSALLLGRIRAAETLPARADRRPLREEIAEGLRFVLHQPLLRRIVACTSIGNLFHTAAGALTVIYALRVLGMDEAGLGLVMSASAVGGLAGAFLAERVARLVGEARVIPVSAVAFGLAFLATPLALPLADVVPPEVTLVGGGAVFSFFVVVYNVAQVSFRQRLCPPALLGRMNASVRFLVWGSMPLGGLLGGWLGTTIGVVPTLWVAAVGGVASAVPVVLSPLVRLTRLPRPDDRPDDPDDRPESTVAR